MKGLMMKDVFTAKKILLVYFLMIVLFSFGGTQTMLFALIYALMLPVNMCSYDERSRFDRMMPALPLTGLQCVLDKYIITYICEAVMMALSVGTTSARCGAWTIPENMPGTLAVMLVTHAIVMPAIIRFGVAARIHFRRSLQDAKFCARGRFYVVFYETISGLSPRSLPPKLAK